MTDEVKALWKRALEAIASAELLLSQSPNASASRSYYAAYYAISALFALRNVFFKSHDGVEIAIHRDLIRPGILPKSIADRFRFLRSDRQVGDYGILEDIPETEAREDLASAKAIIEAAYNLKPEELTRPGWIQEP